MRETEERGERENGVRALEALRATRERLQLVRAAACGIGNRRCPNGVVSNP